MYMLCMSTVFIRLTNLLRLYYYYYYCAELALMTSVPSGANEYEDDEDPVEEEGREGGEGGRDRDAKKKEKGSTELREKQLEAVSITAASIAGAGDFHLHGHAQHDGGRGSSTLPHLHHPGYKCPQLPIPIPGSSASHSATATATATANQVQPSPTYRDSSGSLPSTLYGSSASTGGASGVKSPTERDRGALDETASAASASDYSPSVASSRPGTDLGYAAVGRQRKVSYVYACVGMYVYLCLSLSISAPSLQSLKLTISLFPQDTHLRRRCPIRQTKRTTVQVWQVSALLGKLALYKEAQVDLEALPYSTQSGYCRCMS